jgi:NADH-quinone oxidoreductase subunit H
MTSASPPHSAPRNWPMIAAGVVALAIVVLVVVAVVAFFVEGGLAAFGAWLYASAWGIFVRYLLESLALLVVVLIFTAILIYAERKIWGAIHLRRGPNVVGPWGTMQPLADFLKFILKEPIIPAGANKGVFVLAPLVSVTLAFAAWAVIPVSDGWAVGNINVGILYLFAVSSLGVYGVIMAGWASNSKYAQLSALRVAAQMVSYEVSIGFVMVSVLLCVGSLNLNDIVRAQNGLWFCIPLFPMFIVFFISGLAECNRVPFDLAEGESEIVAGFMVEYSSMSYAMFFLGEYANMTLMSAMTSILFLGGWMSPLPFLAFIPGPIWLILKICLVMFVFIWVRATFPRFRYDQLMRLGWKIFLPLSLGWMVLTAAALEIFGWLPHG